MILEILKSIFRPGAMRDVTRQAKKEELMRKVLAESATRSPYVRPESRGAVVDDMMRSGQSPYRIDKASLTAEGLRRGAKNSATAVFMHARHRVGRLETIDRLQDAGYKRFSLQSCNNERECAWCKANSGKQFSIDTNIDRLIEESCTYEYCRCHLAAKRH